MNEEKKLNFLKMKTIFKQQPILTAQRANDTPDREYTGLELSL